VLTSAHITAGLDAALTVFRPGHPHTFTAAAVWRGIAGGRDDAALVLITDHAWVPVPGAPVRWGRTVTDLPGIACQASGQPEFVQREHRPIDLLHVTARLNPVGRSVGDRYLLELDQFPPDGDSPWAGMSGAAVFCDDLLAGVIAVDPARRQHAALEAVPAYVLLRYEAFVAAMIEYAGAGSLECEAIELRSIHDATSRSVAAEPVRSPAALLTARRAVVPFHGRDELLADLHAWAAQSDVGVWLLHGPGGQGKTRLAQEFTGRLRWEGWATVWLAPSAAAEDVGVLAAVSSPTVVVVDYAENRAEQLAAVFAALAGVSVKVVLLARTAGAWWQELAATGGEVVRDIADMAVVRVLPVLDSAPAARQQAYRVAVSAFATALDAMPALSGQSWSAIAVSLSRTSRPALVEGSTVLAVQMTALADLLDSVIGPNASGVGSGRGRSPEDRVLDHERGYWASIATARGVMPGLSLATLTAVVVAMAVLGLGNVEAVERVVGRASSCRNRRLQASELCGSDSQQAHCSCSTCDWCPPGLGRHGSSPGSRAWSVEDWPASPAVMS
jgi:hypothetical protein